MSPCVERPLVYLSVHKGFLASVCLPRFTHEEPECPSVSYMITDLSRSGANSGVRFPPKPRSPCPAAPLRGWSRHTHGSGLGSQSCSEGALAAVSPSPTRIPHRIPSPTAGLDLVCTGSASYSQRDRPGLLHD